MGNSNEVLLDNKIYISTNSLEIVMKKTRKPKPNLPSKRLWRQVPCKCDATDYILYQYKISLLKYKYFFAKAGQTAKSYWQFFFDLESRTLDSQWYPLKFYLSNNDKDIVVFLPRKIEIFE